MNIERIVAGLKSVYRRAVPAAVVAIVFCQAAVGNAVPAVDKPNLRWLSGYNFGFLDGDSANLRGFGGFGITAVEEIEEHDFRTELILTMPIVNQVGARLRLGGAAQRADLNFGRLSRFIRVDEQIWAWEVNTGADVFLRDPEIGYLELGYRYRFNTLNSTPELEEQNHVGVLAAGLFFGGGNDSSRAADLSEWDGSGLSLGDVDIPPVDLEMRFVYTRTSLERDGFLRLDTTIPEYGIETLAHVYCGDRFRIGLGGRYSYADLSSSGDLWRRDSRAVLEVLWLPPIGSSQAITLGLNVTGGEIREKQTFATYDRAVATVGIEIGVLYPGGDSLIELLRQRL